MKSKRLFPECGYGKSEISIRKLLKCEISSASLTRHFTEESISRAKSRALRHLSSKWRTATLCSQDSKWKINNQTYKLEKNLSAFFHVCDESNFNASKKVKIAWKDAAISALSFRSTLLVSDKGISALLMSHIQALDKFFSKKPYQSWKKHNSKSHTSVYNCLWTFWFSTNAEYYPNRLNTFRDLHVV